MYHPYSFTHFYALPLSGFVRYPFLPPSGVARSPFARAYPPVDPTLFKQSAQSMKSLVQEINLLMNRLTDNSDFALRLMSAAQAANKKEAERLIRSAGVREKLYLSFNPDVLRIELRAAAANVECCKLSIALRWNH